MNYLSRITLGAATLFFASQVFATDCPSTTIVNSNATFTHATKLNKYWAMTSNEFSFESVSWNVGFLVILPDASTPEEALTQGQSYYNSHVTLNTPTKYEKDNKIQCIYSVVENNHILVAITPPAQLPSLRTLTPSL